MGKPGFLQTNVPQHRAFEPRLKKLAAFAEDTKPEDYKFDTLQGIINGFVSAFQEQLHSEIPTLIAMRPYDSEGLLKVYKSCEAAAGEQDKVYNQDMTLEHCAYERRIQFVVPPMVMGLCDKTFQL